MKHSFFDLAALPALFIACQMSIPAISAGQNVAIGGYTVPYKVSQPYAMTAGPDGALWFTETTTSTGTGYAIGRMTPAGTFNQYSMPYPEDNTSGIATGPDGALWFTEYTSNQIGRITTGGQITSYPIPTANSQPSFITTGPDGALWFTESNANQLGRITTAGQVTEYPIPYDFEGGIVPVGIATGPDGALWFTEVGEFARQIGRMTTTGQVTEYPITNFGYGITTGPDGALWFTESSSLIGRITTAGSLTEYPSMLVNPSVITAGPDGALWFTGGTAGSSSALQLGKITTSGTVTLYPVPLISYDGPFWITGGPEGSLWFTAPGIYGTSSSIGQAVFQTAGLSVSPASAIYQTDLTFTGSGFAPGETVQIFTRGVGSAVLASATAGFSGSATASAPAPASPYGPRLFLAAGVSSRRLAGASFTAEAELIPTPSFGAAGSTVAVQGSGFGSLQAVKLQWDHPNVSLGTVAADVKGEIGGFNFTVPSGAPSGSHTLTAKQSLEAGDLKLDVTAPFTVQ